MTQLTALEVCNFLRNNAFFDSICEFEAVFFWSVLIDSNTSDGIAGYSVVEVKGRIESPIFMSLTPFNNLPIGPVKPSLEFDFPSICTIRCRKGSLFV